MQRIVERVGCLWACVVMAACGSEDISDLAVPSSDPQLPVIQITQVDSLTLAPDPVFEVGANEDGNSPPLYLVQDAAFTLGGDLVVGTDGSSSLLVFDSTGSFLREIGGAGEGPGEFLRVRTVEASGDRLSAWDAAQARLTTFETEGDLVGTLSLREVEVRRAGTKLLALLELSRIGEGRFLGQYLERRQGRPLGCSRDLLLLAIIDGTGAAVTDVGTFSRAEYYRGSGGPIPMPFGQRLLVGATADGFYLGDVTANTLTYYDVHGTPVQRLSLPVQRTALTAADRRTTRRVTLGLMSPRNRADVAESFDQAVELADSLPVFRNLVISGDGRIWLQRYIPADWNVGDDREWLLVDPERREAHRLRLPDRAWILDAKNDLVAIHAYDELDRDVVRVRRLQRR